MLNRKNDDKTGSKLPANWIDEVRNTFNKTYAPECQKQQKSFDIHGETHPDEVVIAVSFLDPNHPETIPVTYVVSADLGTAAPAQKLLDGLIDSAGIFFDQYFSTPDWNDYFHEWTEGEVRGIEFHYIINRENIRLTLMANELLNDES